VSFLRVNDSSFIVKWLKKQKTRSSENGEVHGTRLKMSEKAANIQTKATLKDYRKVKLLGSKQKEKCPKTFSQFYVQ